MAQNIVILEGNLGKDPETRFFQNGSKVTSFTIGANRRYKGEDGQPHEETTWANIKAYGYAAEDAQHLTKGARVIVTGELRQENWVDQQTNQPKSRLIVVASRVARIAFIPQNQSQGAAYGGYPAQQPAAYGGYPAPQSQATAKQQLGRENVPHPVDDKDVPISGTDESPF